MSMKDDLFSRCMHTYGSVSFIHIVRAVLSPGASAVFLFRLSEFLYRSHLGVLGMVVSSFNYHWNSILIGRNASIGDGFVITHTVGVVINGKVKAGKNLVIEHGVTIGSKGRSVPNPVLGDNVYIGAGAKVIGDVLIGNNVKIGANAVVVSDIPDGETAVGIPARIINAS